MKIFLFFFLTTLITKDLAEMKSSFLPPHGLTSPLNEWDNGYTEAEFENIISIIKKIYGPLMAKKGGVLKIKKDWRDGAVNAFAWREGDEYWLEILGGMARYSLVTEDAFVTVICHELGHLLGGLPKDGRISNEGQSDYFATLKCTRKIFPLLNQKKYFNDYLPREMCQQVFEQELAINNCVRGHFSAKALGTLYAKIAKVKAPDFHTPDQSKVKRTSYNHPKPQCRLDTIVAGSLCVINKDDPISYKNYKDGSCNADLQKVGFRPRCWYRPQGV